MVLVMFLSEINARICDSSTVLRLIDFYARYDVSPREIFPFTRTRDLFSKHLLPGIIFTDIFAIFDGLERMLAKVYLARRIIDTFRILYTYNVLKDSLNDSISLVYRIYIYFTRVRN